MSVPFTPLDLDAAALEAIEKRLAPMIGAGDGPFAGLDGLHWSVVEDEDIEQWDVRANDQGWTYTPIAEITQSAAVAEFIAHAPSDIDALVAELRVSRTENQRLRGLLDRSLAVLDTDDVLLIDGDLQRDDLRTENQELRALLDDALVLIEEGLGPTAQTVARRARAVFSKYEKAANT